MYAIKQQIKQTWDKNGKRLPITVAQLPTLVVTQVKTEAKDGYSSIQVGFGETKQQRLNKPMKGKLSKANIEEALQYTKEIRLDQPMEVKTGEKLTITDFFAVGDTVNVTGTSKGTGFTGVIKRWGFSGGPRTHGQSDRERAPGSIGQGTDPGRVWKGKKMAGRDGGLRVTQKNLTIVKIDDKNKEIWFKGTVPGHRGSLLEFKKIESGSFVGLIDDKTDNQKEDTSSSEE